MSLTKNDWQDPKVLQSQVRREIVEVQEKIKLKFDQKRCLGVKYEVGEVVLMQKQPDPYLSSKLQRKYRDRPLQIIEILPGDTYRVAELSGQGRTTYATTTHVSQLKSWKLLDADQDEEADQDGDVDNDEACQSVRAHDINKAVSTQPVSQPANDVDHGTIPGSRLRKPPNYLRDYYC